MKGRKWSRIVLVIVLAAVAYGVRELAPSREGTSPAPTAPVATSGTAETGRPKAAPSGIEQAFERERSGLMIEATGRVQRMLPDDLEGSRHQKLVLELPSGHTVLISHNIDLAPRVPCDVGDTLTVRGQYEWSERGGVVHWTHHDPDGRHPGGWIEHDDRRFE